MKRHLLPTLCAALAVLVIAGCSEEELLAPSSGAFSNSGSFGAFHSEVGPSDIVICIDVSDSIGADELTALAGALGGSLSDPDLVPQDGTVTAAALVYGDTVGVLLMPTPVTADNLANAIVPALQGLLADRIVGGSGFDLPGALLAARSMLDDPGILDRHVLIAGSGAADYPDSAAAICADLGAAGIMVSAVGVGPDAAGAALLEGCALSTGGFFGTGIPELDEVTDEALAYMLHVDIDAEPEHAELPRGGEHTVPAHVFRAEDHETYPVAGLDVTFLVLAGPNMSETLTAPTGDDGAAAFTYSGDGGPGTDMILVSALHPGTGTAMTDTVTVAWINAPPVCDAGGPYSVTVDSDTAAVMLDATGSSDADGDTLLFHWSVDCGEVSIDDPLSATPVLTITGDCLCVDSFTVEVMVSDGYDTTTCGSTVHIDDRRPPVVIVREEPLLIWSPNHKYTTVTPQMLLESAEDACGRPIDLSMAIVIEVRSDEPEDHRGDGKTMNDMIVHCPNLVELRGERMGGGNGRVYTVVYRIRGENGVSVDAEAKAIVPHDASDPHAVEDEGCGYTIGTDCDGER
ncbi:MAG: hypothetical protein PHQ19_00575 [Candidatus Krumholzibacteria bacterium]|nr:hypothetical protein [Candidatus Krumholzibacteria bacterium]